MTHMSNMTHMTNTAGDALSAERMGMFITSLAGVSAVEAGKAKALYIKNAITDYRAAVQSRQAMGCFTAVFWLMPLFWPFLIGFKRTQRLAEQHMRQRIQNALDIWGDDIRAAGVDIEPLQPVHMMDAMG